MIGGDDIYQVVVAMAPLYVAMFLGYGSVRWWHMFNPDQCEAINRLACYFILPLFTFQFTCQVDPFNMNYRFIAADVISKLMTLAVLVLWAKFCRNGNYDWTITGFSLSSMNSTLVVGVPLLEAMYGHLGADLVIQSCVVQSLLWNVLLLFMLELRRASIEFRSKAAVEAADSHELSLESGKYLEGNKNDEASTRPSHEVTLNSGEILEGNTNDEASTRPSHEVTINSGEILEGNTNVEVNARPSHELSLELEKNFGKVTLNETSTKPSFWWLMKIVSKKLAKNPNTYACILGLIWAVFANRYHIKMPSIIDGSISIMSRAGSGISMFSLGLFMALQDGFFVGGVLVTLLGLVLRFVAGPAALALGSVVMGLHGNPLRVIIVQAALPQSTITFVFAREHDLHVGVLSTGIMFGTIISLPILIAYYAALEIGH